MRKWHIAGLLLAALLAAIGGVVICAGGRKPYEGPAAVGMAAVQEKEDEMAVTEHVGLEEMLTRFAEVIYNYDTRERRFYEGAEPCMTGQGYQMLVPFSAGEEPEEKERPAAVISSLNDVSYYYNFTDDSNVQVMMEARFSLSRSGHGEILQYTKLSVKETEEGWKIDAYEPVATMER